MKKDSSDSKWGEKFSREKGVSSEIAGRICRRAGRKRVGGGGEKRIISDGRRNERMDERERVRERRGEGRVICTGRRYAGWIFHEENSVTGRRFSGHVELVRRRAAFRSISDLVRTFAFLFNVRCLWIRREFPSCFPPPKSVQRIFIRHQRRLVIIFNRWLEISGTFLIWTIFDSFVFNRESELFDIVDWLIE